MKILNSIKTVKLGAALTATLLSSSVIASEFQQQVETLEKERAATRAEFEQALVVTTQIREKYFNYVDGIKKTRTVLERATTVCSSMSTKVEIGECIKLAVGLNQLIISKAYPLYRLRDELGYNKEVLKNEDLRQLYADTTTLIDQYRALEKSSKELLSSAFSAQGLSESVAALSEIQNRSKVRKEKLLCENYPTDLYGKVYLNRQKLRLALKNKSAYGVQLEEKNYKKLVSQKEATEQKCDDLKYAPAVLKFLREVEGLLSKHSGIDIMQSFIKTQCSKASSHDVKEGCSKGRFNESFLYALDLEARGQK